MTNINMSSKSNLARISTDEWQNISQTKEFTRLIRSGVFSEGDSAFETKSSARFIVGF